jgi:hypothetical protein
MEIVAAEVGESKKGFAKIDLRWKVLEGEFEGRQIFDSMSFHPDALWKTKAVLKALNFPDDFAGEVGPEDLLNRQATVYVSVETGRIDPATQEPYPDRNRVVKVKPLGQTMSSLLA